MLLPAFSGIEDSVTGIIGERFGLDLSHHRDIKRADLVTLATESVPYSTESRTRLQGIGGLPGAIRTMQPEQAKQAFLRAFERLYAED